MIKQVRSNNPKFKTAIFESGFNVILAERSKVSTDKDSRNGLGKSSLLNIIHFLLGNNPGKDSGVRKTQLSKWKYKTILSLSGKEYSVVRDPNDFSHVCLEGDF
ncbi:MAG TPA: DUF2326 domain-containing protein, partial [Bacteroidia bacterium]